MINFLFDNIFFKWLQNVQVGSRVRPIRNYLASRNLILISNSGSQISGSGSVRRNICGSTSGCKHREIGKVRVSLTVYKLWGGGEEDSNKSKKCGHLSCSCSYTQYS